MKNKMKNRILYSLVALLYSITTYADISAEPESSKTQIVPLAQFENLNLTSQQIQSTSVGLLTQSESVMFIGLYTQHVFKNALLHDFPRRYHTIDTLLDAKRGRYQYLGIFKSQSDKPVSGGINTFQAGAVYGYELIKEPNMSLVLGGGIAVGNFGLTTSNGDNWPIIPVPLVRWNYHSNSVNAKFEFLTSPNLSFTLAPKGKVRLIGDFRMDQLRDARDLIFELALAYRPYSEKDKFGDFAGLSIGLKNDNYGAFKLGHKEEKESIEVHYYSLFTSVDISVLKVSAGYAFGGRSLYREKQKQDMGEGYFISVQGMYPF